MKDIVLKSRSYQSPVLGYFPRKINCITPWKMESSRSKVARKPTKLKAIQFDLFSPRSNGSKKWYFVVYVLISRVN